MKSTLLLFVPVLLLGCGAAETLQMQPIQNPVPLGTNPGGGTPGGLDSSPPPQDGPGDDVREKTTHVQSCPAGASWAFKSTENHYASDGRIYESLDAAYSVIGAPKTWCLDVRKDFTLLRLQTVNKRSCLAGGAATRVTITNPLGESRSLVANHVSVFLAAGIGGLENWDTLPKGVYVIRVEAGPHLPASCDFHHWTLTLMDP